MPTQALDVVHAYQDTFRHPGRPFDADRLLAVLAEDVVFESPLTGRRVGARPLLPGIERFARSVRAFRPVHELAVGSEVAVLYDCDLSRPEGTHRFAEFFRVDQGRITELRLLFDATEYRKLG